MNRETFEEDSTTMQPQPVKALPYLLGAVLLLGAAPISLRAQKKSARHASLKRAAATRTADPSAAKRGANPRAVKASSKHRKSHRREPTQKVPTPDRIREIQSALAREGAYTREPNGKWDASSAEAMKQFQASRGLSPSGKLDALSLQKLGLGSEVAGRAAPRAPSQPRPDTPVQR